MRYGKYGVLTGLLLMTTAVCASFFPGTQDIPIMDELTLQDPADDVAFDTPAGQILTFDGTTVATPAAVRRFYAETLGALGWTKTANDTYTRGDDTFHISFPAPGQVHFDMTLAGAAF